MSELWRGLLLLLPAPLLLAQSTGTIEGSVVCSATQAPVAGVTVMLHAVSQRTVQAMSDPSGAFRIADVAEAIYMVEVSKAGWGQDPHKWASPVDVKKGETVHVPVELVRLGILRGRVVDGDGHPVARAKVDLAHMRGGSASITETDAEGNFEISDSGTFTLRARAPVELKPPSSKERSAWAPTFYPRNVLRSEAARVVLRPGEEMNGYEIAFRDVPLYRLRGAVVNDDGTPAPNVQVSLIDPDRWNQRVEAQAVSGPNGGFEFASVWARDWDLEAEAKRGDAVLKGFSSATVSNDNVDGVVVRIASPFAVTGTLEGLRRDEKRRPELAVGLLAQVGETQSGVSLADGTVRVDDVYPGPYIIAAFGKHPGYYMDSVLIGNRDVTGQTVELSSSSLPFHVILRPNPGQVRGTVVDCRGETVVLWGLDEPVLAGEYFHRTTCDPNGGRFEFADLRPGDYHACAFARVGDYYLLQDLSFARALKQVAARVHVDKGQTANVELKPVAWPE